MEAVLTRDVIKVINEFSSKQTLDFDEFKKLWTGYQFYYLHCVCMDQAKRDYNLEAMYTTATNYLINTRETPLLLYERVGAAYMWYCLFVTQPLPGNVKIRLSLSDWECVQSFHSFIRSFRATDADYALCRLKALSAFHICIERQRLCLGQQSETADKQLMSIKEKSLQELESNILPTLNNLQEFLQNYTSLKVGLANHLPPHLLSSASQFDPLLTPERMKGLRETSGRPPGEEGEEEGEGEEGEDEETRRQKVLRQAYKAAPKKVSKRRGVSSKATSSKS